MRRMRFLAVTGYACRHVAEMMPVDYVDEWQRQTGIDLACGPDEAEQRPILQGHARRRSTNATRR